jgi:hypothetical protein
MRQLSFAVLIAAAAGCGVAPAPSVATEAVRDRGDNPNPVLFAKDARPFGADMATWGERASQWIYEQPLAHNPLFDQTGADCAVDQDGPVWFIPPIAGGKVFSGSRACTIPHHKAIFLDIGVDTNDYPCPDPNFHPAPGQSLFDFLIATDKPIMDSVNLLEVALDGQALNDVLGYRFISDDLFYIEGDTSLVQRLDSCITGAPQPAIVDGFFMMFKPLPRGAHTIVVHGTNTFGDDKTFTYHLTIE